MEQIGRHDNFFELGGDSILSLQIVARARTAGWKLTPRHIFERQTLAQLAGVAERVPDLMHGNRRKSSMVPFHCCLCRRGSSRRISLTAITGDQSVLLRARESLAPERLRAALGRPIRGHDSLRLRFSRDRDGQWTQHYSTPSDAEDSLLWVCEASSPDEVTEIATRVQRSLDIESGPLLRAVLIPVANAGERLLLVVHHLVVDGVSWRILLDDLQRAYAQGAGNTPIELPPKSSSYRRWSQHIERYAADRADQLRYWLKLCGAPDRLPCDQPENVYRLSDQSSVSLRLNRVRTEGAAQGSPGGVSDPD